MFLTRRARAGVLCHGRRITRLRPAVNAGRRGGRPVCASVGTSSLRDRLRGLKGQMLPCLAFIFFGAL